MLLIKNGHIKTMAGEDLIGYDLLIDDKGKIAKIEKGIDAQSSEIIDAAGKLITPGLVEAHSHIGLSNIGMGWQGYDYNETADPITPHLRAIDSINPMCPALFDAIKGGVTTACTGPGSRNVLGGNFAAIKLYGKRVDKMIVKYPVAMKCAFGENTKNCYGQLKKKSPVTRMAVAAMLRETLFKAKEYLAAKEAGKNPTFDIRLEAMIPVLKREIPLKAHVHRADDIFTAIRIAKEFDLKLTLDHCTDGALIKEDLAREGYPVFVGPSWGTKSKPEVINKSFKTAGELYAAGVPVGITSDAPITPLQHLTIYAGLAVAEGLPLDAAWRAITSVPATYMGIGDRVGSLEVGKDGDVVIWSADPLVAINASVEKTIIDGKIVYSK